MIHHSLSVLRRLQAFLTKHFAGFTLLESLVAVTIITLSVAGPITAARSSLVSAYTARDRVTASYLAQEAVEYIRSVRDDAYLSNQNSGAWSAFLTAMDACVSPGTCYVDPLTDTFGACGTSIPCDVWRTGSGNGMYHQGSHPSGFVATPFSRTVTVQSNETGIMTIAATVRWKFRDGTTRSATFTDVLTDWQTPISTP